MAPEESPLAAAAADDARHAQAAGPRRDDDHKAWLLRSIGYSSITTGIIFLISYPLDLSNQSAASMHAREHGMKHGKAMSSCMTAAATSSRLSLSLTTTLDSGLTRIGGAGILLQRSKQLDLVAVDDLQQ
uniref:Uncharacterized protein n=1 Tax=Oryza meridionalis TaxID=40149 RepID=A0A0E0D2F6_9ORYZ